MKSISYGSIFKQVSEKECACVHTYLIRSGSIRRSSYSRTENVSACVQACMLSQHSNNATEIILNFLSYLFCVI